MIRTDYKRDIVYHSAFIIFFPWLLWKAYKINNKKRKLIVVNLCPSPILMKIEKAILKILNIRLMHIPIKLRGQPLEVYRATTENAIEQINDILQTYHVWVHCFWGCHRTGVVCSILNNDIGIYHNLCHKHGKPKYQNDIEVFLSCTTAKS
jgi:predicted protein tyrosine phosphatase